MVDLKELNEVDWEVIKWKAQGLTTKEISEVMVLSPQTIKNRLSQIYDKLGVRNGIEMLKVLYKSGVDPWNVG
ncbi:MAG TPA: helix-turn-helix transcriptional regulator [Candidatus Hydrothermia bacterium]|nr:helix-turn-helix transcriptional regulator [Candidatus Hydrothermia bacterium]